MVIAGDSPPLLGKATAELLGVLHVGVNAVQCSQADIIAQYPGIEKGIGTLKNVVVTLDIDKSVTPVARTHSRVPFHLRDKVAAEIDKMIRADIIEKVTGPTEWVSRIVTPPKPKKPEEIRLCVDMREANKAISRTRHVTPTIDELVSGLRGATVFSKIDLRSGYHQLVLSPNYITTFSTHVGLYRYKRSFGVNSAAEVFQDAIQSVLEGIAGTMNISDDIIIYSDNQQQHDKALSECIAKLHRSGLTINVQKCEFNKSKIEFFGYVFSNDGISPDPKKVNDLKEAPKPQNKSDVRSFLGMAQYSARVIHSFAPMSEPLRALTRQDKECGTMYMIQHSMT